MPLYRLEIEGNDAMWVTAHDERRAVELVSAHLCDGLIDANTSVALISDSDGSLILRAPAGEWCASVKR